MPNRSTGSGLGRDYHFLSYQACPCVLCNPVSPKGKRRHKQDLHQAARRHGRQALRRELAEDHSPED